MIRTFNVQHSTFSDQLDLGSSLLEYVFFVSPWLAFFAAKFMMDDTRPSIFLGYSIYQILRSSYSTSSTTTSLARKYSE